jgi:hypothetical protein
MVSYTSIGVYGRLIVDQTSTANFFPSVSDVSINARDKKRQRGKTALLILFWFMGISGFADQVFDKYSQPQRTVTSRYDLNRNAVRQG